MFVVEEKLLVTVLIETVMMIVALGTVFDEEVVEFEAVIVN